MASAVCGKTGLHRISMVKRRGRYEQHARRCERPCGSAGYGLANAAPSMSVRSSRTSSGRRTAGARCWQTSARRRPSGQPRRRARAVMSYQRPTTARIMQYHGGHPTPELFYARGRCAGAGRCAGRQADGCKQRADRARIEEAAYRGFIQPRRRRGPRPATAITSSCRWAVRRLRRAS